MKGKIFLAVSIDKLEIPLALFESYKEMATWSGKSINTLKRDVCRSRVDRRNKCKYVKVSISELDEDDELEF